MTKVNITILVCQQCGHTWTPRVAKVTCCPDLTCHSLRWNIKNNSDGKGRPKRYKGRQEPNTKKPETGGGKK
ncbi:MAG: hypothetical protein KAR06_08865 [Deltaproteobacteria bacterium]|nr:hypothetical protein [Deltaproteobacteria bacterium]